MTHVLFLILSAPPLAILYRCQLHRIFGQRPDEQGEWKTQLSNTKNGETFEVRSSVIINACGPYVDQQNQVSNQTTEHRHVYSKGIHLVVPQITNNEGY
jgi:glycerol-3-phosphate dehydrogenase